MAGKTVKEIIEAFEKLPKEEQNKVYTPLFGIKSPPGVNPPSKEVSDGFKKIVSEIFAENEELFRKLAH